MKTDYKNLNAIESLAVFFAVTGLLLIGAISFATLPSRTQVQVVSAVQIFDMHEQFSRQWREGFKLLTYDLPQEFLGEFYEAFTEVAIIPYETIQEWQELGEDTKTAYAKVLIFSETLAREYDSNFVKSNQTAVALARMGTVSGASITTDEIVPQATVVVIENIVPTGVVDLKISDDLRGRGYEPPELNKIYKQVLMFMEE